jgi:hypothetical protein
VTFEIVGPILHTETIARGHGIRELQRLIKFYGKGKWRKCKGTAKIKLASGSTLIALQRSIGMKHTESAVKKSRSSASPTETPSKYLVCLSNNGYSASLEVRKIYAVLPDRDAAKLGLVRIIDESGEDYLYPASSFGNIALPRAVEKALSVI